MRWMKLTVVALGAAAAIGCSKGSETATTNPAMQHLENAGRELRDAATQAAENARPAIEAAEQKTREAIHEAATRVSGWTATQPANNGQ